MPLVDFCMPEGSTYLGFRVPDGCTVAQWKAFLELGGTGDKVLYARKLACHRTLEKTATLQDSDVLGKEPGAVFVAGPGSVVSMLELALRKLLGGPVPPGRLLMCASPHCPLLVYSKPTFGGYCCVQCCRGSGHSDMCEQRLAPNGTPKAEPAWMPEDPQGKYQTNSLTQEDLLADEAFWAPPEDDKKESQRALVQRTNIFIGPYLDYAQRSAAECISLYKTAEHGWSLDYEPNFVCELLYEGFYTRGLELALQQPPVQMLVVSWDRKLSVWDFQDTHVSRQVRKRAKQHTLTMDTAFEEVLLGCVRMHGENWLFRGWRWMARKLFSEGYTGANDLEVSIHSFELWDESSNLVAGDIGSFVGGVYTSMTGFHERLTRSAGELQMVLTNALLHMLGIAWVDLGQVLPYKELLGARVVTRREYLELLHRDRDMRLESSVDRSKRFTGQELLSHILAVVGSHPDAGGQARKKHKAKGSQRKPEAAAKPQAAGDAPVQALTETFDGGPVWEAALALAERQLSRQQPTKEEAAPTRPNQWHVVGGRDKGGIIVRSEESTSSAAMPTRLAPGTRIRPLQIAGNRLQFQKVEGEGPAAGWVSIRYEGRPLVEPWPG